MYAYKHCVLNKRENTKPVINDAKLNKAPAGRGGGGGYSGQVVDMCQEVTG